MTHGLAASILVLTEDGSNYAYATLESLVRELLRHSSPGSRVDGLRFEPANDEARKLLAGNQFPDGKKYFERARLHRTITAKLLAEGGFVFQHIDADRRWSERTKNPSVNVSNLEKHIVSPMFVNLSTQATAAPRPDRDGVKNAKPTVSRRPSSPRRSTRE